LVQDASSIAGSSRKKKSTYSTISDSTAIRVWASGAIAEKTEVSKAAGSHGGAAMVSVPVSQGAQTEANSDGVSARM
jgi:hypothetical protein